MKPFAKPFYTSAKWRNTQKAYMKSRHYVCERCGRPAEIVHHKIWLNPTNINNPDITLNWDNLEALCRTCHQHEHFIKGATAPGLKFDENGNLVKRYPTKKADPLLKNGEST